MSNAPSRQQHTANSGCTRSHKARWHVRPSTRKQREQRDEDAALNSFVRNLAEQRSTINLPLYIILLPSSPIAVSIIDAATHARKWEKTVRCGDKKLPTDSRFRSEVAEPTFFMARNPMCCVSSARIVIQHTSNHNIYLHFLFFCLVDVLLGPCSDMHTHVPTLQVA